MRSLLLLALLGCGHAQKEQIENEKQSFQCRQRIVSYIAAHHMGGSEIGVQMDCAEAGPRIKRWRTDKQGVRQEDAHSLTPGEFNTVWREVDGTGWPNLKDCGNGTMGKQDPVYVFDIKDDQNKASFQCQTRVMPYPYNDITDPLDLAANQGRNQLRDDEPADAKALDKKDKQK